MKNKDYKINSENSKNYISQKLNTFLIQKCKEFNINNCLQTIQYEITLNENLITIYFPHSYFAEWFKLNLKPEFEKFIHNNIYQIKQINYKIFHQQAQNQHFFQKYKIEKQYNFAQFLYNKKNYLAFLSAYELANNCTKINPFILSGEQGVGKTHLIKSIGNLFIKNNCYNNILLLNIKELNQKYKNNYNTTSQLRKNIYNFDVFILEDIHLLNDYQYLQEELLYIFDYFIEKKQQAIFSCTGEIANFSFLDPKLKSRLQSGLIVHLKQPDLDLRLQYIQRQNQKKDLYLSERQILQLAKHFNNFKQLKNILLKLLAHKESISCTINKRQFENIITSEQEKIPQRTDYHKIFAIISEYFQFSTAELQSSYRNQKLVFARQIGMYLCRELTNLSYSQIGTVFGGKDHSTVMYAIKKVKKLKNESTHVENLLKILSTKCK